MSAEIVSLQKHPSGVPIKSLLKFTFTPVKIIADDIQKDYLENKAL